MARWTDIELHGGPLDGEVYPIDLDDPDLQEDPGMAVISPNGAFGPGGRSWYAPDESGRWVWAGDSA